jgi:hypothetical protein
LQKVLTGDVPPPERLIARAEMYMISGLFIETEFSKYDSEESLSPACKKALQIEVTDREKFMG